MSEPKALRTICRLLTERYREGQEAAARLREWVSGRIPFTDPQVLERHLEEQHVPLLFDAFGQMLPFGTGGRRGRVGYGANRLNPTTVAMTVQGHCNYLLRQPVPNRSDRVVVVANDRRRFLDIAGVYRFLGAEHPLLGTSSRSLARLACRVYAGNGLVACLAEPHSDQATLATPELSFFIPQLHALGGVNLSASHNPPDDNGVKVYDSFGSQPTAPDDQDLVNAMNQATDIRTLPFDEALAQGLVRALPEGLHEDYIETYVRLYGDVYRPRTDVPIVYTPLCGCGMSTVGAVLKRLGFPLLVPPKQEADGTFAAIPLKAPNPEVAEATVPATQFADAASCGVVLSSDPDADRVGVEAKLADGSWYHFDGNQIGAILCYFLMLDSKGPRRKGLVLTTTVTTKLIGKIVEQSPGSMLVEDLLVGFKHMAQVLKALRRTGRYKNIVCSPDQLVLATEEAHGVLVVPTILDKDATPACMYLAGLYQRLREEQRTLLDYYIQILEQLGGYDTVNRSITLRGAEGTAKKEGLLASLRQSPPATLGGQSVRKIVDYWDQERFGQFVSDTDRLPRNVLQYFSESFIITVRPSGTEPKLKFYCQLLPGAGSPKLRGPGLFQEARARADRVSRLVYNDLLARIDLSLSEAALYLPDIVDLDQKRAFEQKTAVQLRAAMVTGRVGGLPDLLAWLRQETMAMTPGADPLPALKAAVASLAATWSKDLASSPLLAELEEWARQSPLLTSHGSEPAR